ncbi:hypothetical protein GOP47_0024166 [Adiantum capillus-veneris]|uniref:Uncharacterized protein n=1 Tax=Adiantum capillus-veneris TaxID=13818 RepID=A0A9D4Z6M3_ADICA|nr:hypothetical protein GOP47_0024166 [Adiantum capillus-veneris]
MQRRSDKPEASHLVLARHYIKIHIYLLRLLPFLAPHPRLSSDPLSCTSRNTAYTPMSQPSPSLPSLTVSLTFSSTCLLPSLPSLLHLFTCPSFGHSDCKDLHVCNSCIHMYAHLWLP